MYSKSDINLTHALIIPINNDTNGTTLFCSQERNNVTLEDPMIRFIFIFAYAFFGVFGVFINSFVIWIIKTTEQWRSLVIRLIMYLSVVDIGCSLISLLRLVLFLTARQVSHSHLIWLIRLSVTFTLTLKLKYRSHCRSWRQASIPTNNLILFSSGFVCYPEEDLLHVSFLNIRIFLPVLIDCNKQISESEVPGEILSQIHP